MKILWKARFRDFLKQAFGPANNEISFEGLEPRLLFSAAPVEAAPAPEPEPAAAETADVQSEATAGGAADTLTTENPPTAEAPEADPAPAVETDQTEVDGDQGVTLVSIDERSAQLNRETIEAADVRAEAPKEITFVSSNVRDRDALVADLASNDGELIVLDENRDGVEQIAEILAGRSGIDAVHLYSHGTAGALDLGSATLDGASMIDRYADALSVIRDALAEDADFLIYGCDFGAGESGQAAVEQLAGILDADVAASDDDTGWAGFGGDWDLEIHTGAIETDPAAALAWRGVLAPSVIDLSGPVAAPPQVVIDDRAAFNAALTGNPGETVEDSDGNFATDPALASSLASVTRTGTINGNTYTYDIYDIDFSNAPVGTLTPGVAGGDINQLDNINIESPAAQAGAAGTGSWGVDTSFGQNTTRNALLFDFTTTPGGLGIGHFGVDLHDVESSQLPGRQAAEYFVYNGGVLIDSGVIDWVIDDGDGESHFFGYSANDPSGFFDQIVIVVGDDDLNGDGTGNLERLAADRMTFGQAFASTVENTGTDFATTFTEDGPAVSIADTDMEITDVDDTHIESATIVLTNAMTDDVLAVGALPAGIGSSIDTSVPGQITVTLTGTATLAEYETAIQAITFENTSDTPDLTDRIINVTVNDGDTDSNTAVTTVHVIPTDETLTIGDVTEVEDGSLIFTVTLNGDVSSSFTVDVNTTAGSATGGGVDYTDLVNHTLTFTGFAGETQTFTVVPDDDSLIENPEDFTVALSNASSGEVNVLGAGATGTILDNDARPPGVTTDVELVANGSGGFDLVIEDVETDAANGFASDVGDADSLDGLFFRRVGDNYVVSDLGGLALGSPIIGASRNGASEIIVPVAMVTGDVIIRTGAEDDSVLIGDSGATLTGGLFVDTEDPANRYNDFDVIHYDSDTELAAGGDSVFRAETINGLADSRLEATGSGSVTWDAGRNIFMDTGASVISESGDITYEANLDGQFTDNFAAVHLNGAEIESDTGNVDIDGRAGATGNYNRGVFLDVDLVTGATGSIQTSGAVTIDGTGGGGGGLYGTGVAIKNSTVESTGNAQVNITGTGGDGSLFNEGVSIQMFSTIDAGTGNLTLVGFGGTTGDSNRGINVAASTLTSDGGDIAADGTGGGAGFYSMGAQFTATQIGTTGTGTITLRGTGAAGTMANAGVKIATNSSLSTVDGAIRVEGTGDGSTLLNHGVQVASGSAITASGAGSVTLTGTGGAGNAQNVGVEISHATVSVRDGDLTVSGSSLGTLTKNRGVNVAYSTLSSSGTANIIVSGTGSSAASGTQNTGAHLDAGTIDVSGSGNVTLTGTGGTGGTGSIGNDGLILATASQVTLASGNLVMSGSGGGNGSSSIGVGIKAASVITVGGTGSATIDGTGANGTMLNTGVLLANASQVRVTDGDLSVSGTGRGSTGLNDGIKIAGAIINASGGGDVSFAGTGSQSANAALNVGFHMVGGSVKSGSGSLTIDGRSGTGTSLNQGIRVVGGTLGSSTGATALRGVAAPTTTGVGNMGVHLLGTSLESKGTIGVEGTGGGGTLLNHGVYMQNITTPGAMPTVTGIAGVGDMSDDENGNFFDP